MASELHKELSATCRTRIYPRETHLRVLDIIMSLEARIAALESSAAAAYDENGRLLDSVAELREFLDESGRFRVAAPGEPAADSAGASAVLAEIEAASTVEASDPPTAPSGSCSGVGDEPGVGGVPVHEPEGVPPVILVGEGQPDDLVGVYRVEEVEELIEAANEELADRMMSLSRKNARALREFLRAPRGAGAGTEVASAGGDPRSAAPKHKAAEP